MAEHNPLNHDLAEALDERVESAGVTAPDATFTTTGAEEIEPLVRLALAMRRSTSQNNLSNDKRLAILDRIVAAATGVPSENNSNLQFVE